MEYFDYEGTEDSKIDLTKWLQVRFSIFPQPFFDSKTLEVHPGDRVLHDDGIIILLHQKYHPDC